MIKLMIIHPAIIPTISHWLTAVGGVGDVTEGAGSGGGFVGGTNAGPGGGLTVNVPDRLSTVTL